MDYTAIATCVCVVIVCTLVFRRYLEDAILTLIRLRPVFATPERLKQLREEFHPRAGDVFVATFPKSGTTWMQQIVRQIMTAGGAFRPDDDRKLTEAFPWVEALGLPFAETDLPFGALEAIPSPRLLKSHMRYHQMPGGAPHASPAKYIYVARNPKDTVVSFYHFAIDKIEKGGQRRLPWWICFKMFMKGNDDFGCWYDHVLDWWKQRNQPNILFLKYEDMQKDLPGIVRKVADFVGHDGLEQKVIDGIAQQCTFHTMKSNPTCNYSWVSREALRSQTETLRSKTNAVFRLIVTKPLQLLPTSRSISAAGGGLVMMRKGVVGDWKEHLSQKQSAEIDRLWMGRLQTHGLEFDFEL